MYVINRYRDAEQNLRTQLKRIIRRAGLEPWPKPFHNLRASRETELAQSFPLHVVCAWIGNTERIAAKHYLQVTEDYFALAATEGTSGAKSGSAAPSCTDSHEMSQAQSNLDLVPTGAEECESVQKGRIPPRGLEPRSSG